MASASIWFLFLYFGFCIAWIEDRPVLESRDGNLIISSAKDRNITLQIIGGGYVNVNEINLLHVASAAQNAARLIDRWKMGYLAHVENSLRQLTSIVTGSTGLQKRVDMLERSINMNNMPRIGNRSIETPLVPVNQIRRIKNRLNSIENRLTSMATLLNRYECENNPCQNGGTCEDLYNSYKCHCPPAWEGQTCTNDVNECARLIGTDLGCQNGATCRNLPGSYRCDCLPGWYGVHCTKKIQICHTENSAALCGEHGVCVAKNNSYMYTCICDQGWESDGTNPACVKDVDECAGNHPSCSVNPPVRCLNTPGSFVCGPCPHGYSGNGYYCTDIDECLTNNGGCSMSPYVQCINTLGSRICSSCPPGYRGDGINCHFVGGCTINNGGCHPLAICMENPALSSSYVMCHCPQGYIGDGMGPNGCQLNDISINTACSRNPCVHGTCIPNGTSNFTCMCDPEYSGARCNIQANPCLPNPCRNSGTCVSSDGQAMCQCTSSFTGSRCETARQSCGGISRNSVGVLQFPISGSTYQNGLSCAWILITEPLKVLNVTFTSFNLEQSADCKFDFLQIHDGRNAASQMINRFCGHTLPNGNGNIISSHNSLYLWFHSDNSVSLDGFALQWNSIDPVCGGILSNNYGTIKSPGSPGRYPPNRDCTWEILAPLSKRIQFHFGQMMLEEHPTCENDYVEILGIENERLEIYCNHTHPPPLITPGSTATVRFHSDSAGQDAGFQIHYSTVEGVPGCGGTYTTTTGTINSPGRSNYEPNMECEWKIQLPVGERIKVSWLKFNLEESSSCNFDFVEIYDGPDTQSQLLGRYCGSNMPPTIKSNSNTLVLFFKSDYSFEEEGFELSYETMCGGEYYEETGILTSPSYPNSYSQSKSCTYEIIQSSNKRIVLKIEDMDIESTGIATTGCYYDYIEIYDGDNEDAPKLGTLCGDQQLIPATPYYSTHNYMYIKFVTDDSIEQRGFKANYTTIDRRCGGFLKESNGVIQPLTQDGFYFHNEDCIWTIQAPPGYVIQLNWLSFNLEQHLQCRHDYVKIYEHYTLSNQHLLATYCGDKKPPPLTTLERVLTILFHTDESITEEGFVVSYTFVDVTKVCGAHYVKQNGIIRSPNYPENYYNKKKCVWIIEAQNRHKIILRVNHFDLEDHPNCIFDYLEIRNGGHETAPLIGKYCGTKIPTEIISQTNQLHITFVSDITRTRQGFEIEWDSTTEGCGGTMSSATGDIMSPYYPQPYAENADCYWKIAVAAGNLVQLEIVDLALEQNSKCRYDFIEIFDGINHRTNGRRYCNNTYPTIIQSKSNEMTIRFHSDFSHSARGFHLKYKAQCHNKLQGHYGVIESLNFPNKYEHSTNCSWIIEAPIGNSINITFSHFDLEESDITPGRCDYDYLQITESDDNDDSTLGRFCGTVDLPMRIHSTKHRVRLTFITDSYVAFNGFRLEWVVHGCGGHLTKAADRFTSPQYPSHYSKNIDCRWLIEVDYTYSIELTLHDMDIDEKKSCDLSFLQIYGGNEEDAPLLDKLCFSHKPMIYTSTGNKMFVELESTIDRIGRGFNASYRSVPLRCGGKFTTDSGIIHSANYPQNYPHSQNCEWLIEVDNNHLVNLTFLDFDVEERLNCTDDYVKIFDGPTRYDPLLGTHCHNRLPPSYISSSNQMLVVMRTDTVISAKGFKAQYSWACGARIIVKDHGFLTHRTTSGNVHNGYRRITNCTWTLIAENPGDHVTATFTDINFINMNSCLLHYIQIFEGESIEGTSLGKWCDNIVPVPITSTGSSLTLHLFVISGFINRFSVTYSVLNTACGGNYTSMRGTITSPGYPHSYPMNSECIWILNNSPGNKISITFSEFDIVASENCDLDYLEIREDSGIGKLIKTSCGQDATTVTSSRNLWLKFKSDNSTTAKGFIADYNIIGGNELQGSTGRITSPLYPMYYQGFTRVPLSWRITVDRKSIIRIEFRDLQLEKSIDMCNALIRIYDGYNAEAPKILEVCGFNLPDPVQSSSNVVYITMEIFNFHQGHMFDLTWLEIPRETTNENNREIKLSECNKEVAILNNSFTFSSPGWPTGYAENLHCNWLFTSPPGTHLVLIIISINLEESIDCVADSISIYSGYALTSTINAKLEHKLCLSNSSQELFKIPDNVMTVKFNTDEYINKTGFNAYVYQDCGGSLAGPNGVIEYNNSSFPITSYHYTPYRTCEWHVKVKAGKTIKVHIIDMSISKAQDNTCTTNYLMLRNGGEASSPLLGNGKYCGNVAPAELETAGNRLYVKISGHASDIRFNLTYREINMNCGGEFVLTNKQKQWEITSPNYPNIPPPYAECFWIATAPAGERITIHFLERFDLSFSENCEREYIEIKDGGTDHSRSMGIYCKDVAPSSMSTTGNMIYIHFYTGLSEPSNGFKARIVSGEICGGTLRGNNGVIQSPNYPYSYPKNLSCQWWIVGPSGHTLKIQFRDIHLPGFRRCDMADRVEIGEKPRDNNNSTISIYCGLQKPDPIETSSNEAYIFFYSDNREYMNYRGFSINFTASRETCGGSLIAMSGIIKSPGYPNPSTRYRYCEWQIELPKGYQIKVNILDKDFSTSIEDNSQSYGLAFYNDFNFQSRIEKPTVDPPDIKSSSNTMKITYSSSPGHRGFKLRYTGIFPAPCGGNLRELEGNITGPTSLPFNETSYMCHWTLERPEYLIYSANDTGVTLTLEVTGNLGNLRIPAELHMTHCSHQQDVHRQYIELSEIGKLCGHLEKPRYLRSPKISNELSILNSTLGKSMNFSIQYKWQPCGGIIQSGISHTIKSPKNISYPISCAWHVYNRDNDKTIQLSFTKFNIGDCEKNYVIIRSGTTQADKHKQFCDGTKLNNIINEEEAIRIEYFTTTEPNDLEFNITFISKSCGGILTSDNGEISSPKFPKQYPNNNECIWELRGDIGYHIGLSFIDRFSLETSNNCEKDYIEAFDWNDDEENNGKWETLGKVCGRNTPQAFNSSSNRMKVIFHSNEAIQSDGFRAVWNENCGGIFHATENVKIIPSPKFPYGYPSNAFCNYTIVAPGEDIVVEFTDFNLESDTTQCRFDNVTVRFKNLYNQERVEIYCGRNKPPLQTSISQIEIIFNSDNYEQYNGFRFKYFLNKCGGIITKPTELKPLMHGEEYFGRINCTWIIKAPQGKSILLRFEKLVLQYSPYCRTDQVAIYDGNVIDFEKRAAVYCGNLTENLPLFKSESNFTVVNIDIYHRDFDITAKVLFTTSSVDGCGGTINMTSTRSKSFRTQQAATYQSLEECHWTVITSPGKTIRFTINSIDIKNLTNNSTNITSNNKCTGDYLEIRDGGGFYAEFLGKYCGNVIPVPILSSSNKMWIKFYTDGTTEGAGVTAILDTVDSLCGLSKRIINETTQILTSPGYPNTYTSGIRCHWIVQHSETYSGKIIRIQFIDFDMADSNKCEEEYLEISEEKKYINEGFGVNFIYGGISKHRTIADMGWHLPYSSYKYCGSALPHDYYSSTNSIQVAFNTMSSGHKGFKLEYSTANCDRNYTSEQGRIVHQSFTRCWFTITVPENHTISLYFNKFSIYDKEHCTRNALQIHEGDSSGPLLMTECNTAIPNPVFSTGNKLTLHSWSDNNDSYQIYDIIYTSTDAGRGCGGRIFNYAGRFTSPLYPNIYRNNTLCTWDVSVPSGFKIILRFVVLDIGTKKNCEYNNLKVYDVAPSGELLRSTYCGGDDPAKFEADGNRIFVKYASTVNNVGTGWIIAFMAQSTTQSVDIIGQ